MARTVGKWCRSISESTAELERSDKRPMEIVSSRKRAFHADYLGGSHLRYGGRAIWPISEARVRQCARHTRQRSRQPASPVCRPGRKPQGWQDSLEPDCARRISARGWPRNGQPGFEFTCHGWRVALPLFWLAWTLLFRPERRTEVEKGFGQDANIARAW